MAKRSKHYYVLFTFEGGLWVPQFGDYDRDAVDFERRDFMRAVGLTAKQTAVIRLYSAKHALVQQAADALNA